MMKTRLPALLLSSAIALTAGLVATDADALCFKPRTGFKRPRINVPDASIPKIKMPSAQIWNELRKSLGDIERQLMLVRGVVNQLQQQYDPKGKPAPSNFEPTRCGPGETMATERSGFMGMVVRRVCRPRQPGPSQSCPPGQTMQRVGFRSFCMPKRPPRIFTKGPESLRRPVLQKPKAAPLTEE
jgi:hypothetical protein